MLLLFIYHSESYYDGGHSWSFIFQPFFLAGYFIISGYLAFSEEDVSFSRKLKQVIRSLIIPYIIFTGGLILPKLLFYHNNIAVLLSDIALFRASWFVVTIAICQLLYAWMFSAKLEQRLIGIITLCLFILGCWSVLFYRDLPTWYAESKLMNSEYLPNRMPLCINLVLMTLPFFYLGILWRKLSGVQQNKPLSILKLCVLFAIYIVMLLYDKQVWHSSICIVVHSYNNIMLVFLYAVFGSFMLIEFCRRLDRIPLINYIGRNSILFYFLNGFSLQVITLIVNALNINWGGVCHDCHSGTCINSYSFPCLYDN